MTKGFLAVVSSLTADLISNGGANEDGGSGQVSG